VILCNSDLRENSECVVHEKIELL